MELQTKAEILRKHETYCYQMCFYYTEDEAQSFQLACEILLELARNLNFFTEPYEVQEATMRITLNWTRPEMLSTIR